jgi:hypothetical protein
LEGIGAEKVGIFYDQSEFLGQFSIFIGHFLVVWYIFPRFGILCQEKSGNPARKRKISFLRNENKHRTPSIAMTTSTWDQFFKASMPQIYPCVAKIKV